MALKSSVAHVSVLVAVACAFVLPPVLFGSYNGHDTVPHLLWSRHFAAQFLSGDLYPRWLHEMNGGLGSPAFFYYAPFPYYVTSFFHLFSGAQSDGWTELGLASALALAASGAAAYAWLRPVVGDRAALIAALFYMLMPYHLAVDLFIRFAFAELWAFVWMPVLMHFARRVALGQPGGLLGTSVGYAMLAATHLPTAMVFFPVPLLYAVTVAERALRLRAALGAAGAALLGHLLPAAYLLPALTTQRYVDMECMWGDVHGRNFLLETWGGMKPLLNTTALLTTATALLSYRLATASPNRRETRVLLFVTLGTLFLMTPGSSFVWNAIPPLQKIQFPWRLCTVLALAAAGLLGFARLDENTFDPRRGWRQTLTILGIYVFTALMLAPDVTAVMDKSRGQKKLPRTTQDRPEYRPLWASTFSQVTKDSTESRERIRLPEGSGDVRIVSWEPRRITMACSLPADTWIELRQFFYPGWVARSEGAATPLPLRASVPDGLVTIQVPKGDRTVRVRLEAQREETIGWIVSGLSVLAAAALILFPWLLRRLRGAATREAPPILEEKR
jgi:hypothetical protein